METHLEELGTQIADVADQLARATAAAAEERSRLQSQLNSMQQQLGSLDARVTGMQSQLARATAAAAAQQSRLRQQMQAMQHQQRAAQGRLDSAPANPAAGPSCDAGCATSTPPSSNGCGNAFTGRFHSFVMAAAQVILARRRPFIPFIPCAGSHSDHD